MRDHETEELYAPYRELISHVPPGGTWRDIPPYMLPDRFRGMRRTDSSNLLGRLDPALPAYTVTTQFTNVTVGCFTHPFEDRALTIREAARLQTFPDRYRLVGSMDSRARQIGNAVPPLLAAVLAQAIADQVERSTANRSRLRVVKPAKTLPTPPASGETRRRMKAQKRTDTKPEALLKGALEQRGVLGYEVDTRPLPELRRTADLAFLNERVAVFVNGCFWHGCPDHARDTKSNTKWWRHKIDANKERDDDTDTQLVAAGWTCVRVWEHQPPEQAADVVTAALVQKRYVFDHTGTEKSTTEPADATHPPPLPPSVLSPATPAPTWRSARSLPARRDRVGEGAHPIGLARAGGQVGTEVPPASGVVPSA